MPVDKLKETILDKIGAATEKAYGQLPEQLEVGFPPNTEMGHFAVGCFALAKQFRKSPAEIAGNIVDHLQADDVIAEVSAAGPYINLKIAGNILFGDVCNQIISRDTAYGSSDMGRGRRAMVEYLAPNTNKPLHLGHLRNGALGMAVANMYQATGHWVVKANLVNDRGVHICKSMLAWQRWGKGTTPDSEGIKGDHFVGKFYVRYAREAEKDENLENEIQQMLQKWEAGDPETIDLWKKMNGWVYDGFAATYRRFGLLFDVFYYESDTYKLGKDIIQQGLEKKALALDQNGNTVFFLPEEEFGRDKDGELKRVTVLRSDETALYITQDIGTAILKITDHNLDYSIYVVGSEQEYHFKCLFAMLDALGYEWAKNCYHLSYGMVYLPEGKMKSREGNIVDADDLISEMIKLARDEIRQRDPDGKLSEEEVKIRAQKIGVGAVKFYLLRVRPNQSINFDPAESISFDGFTGPYCQYAYARISGIQEKAKSAAIALQNPDFSLLGNAEEVQLLQKLIEFPAEVQSAVQDLNPSNVAGHIFNTARAFNQFYNKHQVLQADSEQLMSARLELIKATAVVLKMGLRLLGVEVLENM
ncbi:Arginyl-tRNA synthetase (EC [Olavius sp. associated proteobacterium Delta 1]|nr:Arginyl-tRNA synthetase (EC [Olavius sp. associated proteobacterium Delta 1]